MMGGMDSDRPNELDLLSLFGADYATTDGTFPIEIRHPAEDDLLPIPDAQSAFDKLFATPAKQDPAVGKQDGPPQPGG